MNGDQILGWKLIVNLMNIYECLPLFCVCRQFNQLYSEEDWTRMMKQLKCKPLIESQIISAKRRFMIGARENFMIRLRIVQEASTENILKILDYSDYSLTALYDLYWRAVKAEVEREEKRRQDSMNQMYSMIVEQITPEMRENVEIQPIYEFVTNLQQTTSDPVKAIHEFQRWLEEDHPEYKPIVTQVEQQYPLLCTIL